MPALRTFVRAAILTAACVTALAGPAAAKISGTGGPLIAFDRGGDIRVMNERGEAAAGESVNITNSPAVVESAPSWGAPDERCQGDGKGGFFPPNGRTLAYESRAPGSAGDIVVARLSGNPPVLASAVNVTATPDADEGAPAIAASGSAADPPAPEIPWIAFTRGPIGHRDIWAMRLDGSGATQLTATAADDVSPDWSPSGASVVYETGDAAGTRRLAIIDVGYDPGQQRFVVRSPPRPITAGPEHHGQPSWWSTPLARTDPDRIVHVATAFGGTYLDFLEQDPKTTSGPLFAPASVPAPLVHQLTGDPGGDLAPSWRPEGDHVVFDSDRAHPGNRDIFRIKIDATELVRLTQDPAADRRPDWEPYAFGACLDPLPYNPRPRAQTRTPKKSGTKPKPRVSLKLTAVRATTAARGRRVVVRFVVNMRAQASVRVLRGTRTVARKLNRPVGSGSATISINIPRNARGGRHNVRVVVTAGGETRTVKRKVKVGARRARR